MGHLYSVSTVETLSGPSVGSADVRPVGNKLQNLPLALFNFCGTSFDIEHENESNNNNYLKRNLII